MTDRRGVLRWGLGVGLLLASGSLLRSLFWPAPLDDREIEGLQALADALLGEREAAAAALPALLAGASRDRGLRRIIRRGLSELEGLARARSGAALGALSALERDTLLELASRAEPQSVLRVTYERLRLELFNLHYARPEVLAALKLPAPPQPLGYPGYEDAP